MLREKERQREELKQRLEKEKEERKKEREIIKEERRLQQEYIKEWRRVREDLDCDDHKVVISYCPFRLCVYIKHILYLLVGTKSCSRHG